MKKHTAITLLALMALLFTLPFLSCEKDPPPPNPLDASRIEGRWVDMTGTFSPDWHYNFDNGLLTQTYIKAGATLSELTYPYAIRDSTIIIGGDANNAPREWSVNFECHEVVQITQSQTQIGQRFWLTRE